LFNVLTKGGRGMKQIFTIIIAMAFVVLMSLPVFAQEVVGDGYTKIFERNEFETSPHYPIVVDEVHAGYDLDKDGKLEFYVVTDHSDHRHFTLFV
jgi:hypothetical protein